MPYVRELYGFNFIQDWPVYCLVHHTVPNRRSWKGPLVSAEIARVVLEAGRPVIRMRTELDPDPPELAVKALGKHIEEYRETFEKLLIDHLGAEWWKPQWWQAVPEVDRFQDDPAIWEGDLKTFEVEEKAKERAAAASIRAASKARRQGQEVEAPPLQPASPLSFEDVLDRVTRDIQAGKPIAFTPDLLKALVVVLVETRAELARLKDNRS